MNVACFLERAARIHPERQAIFRGEQPWATYGEWAERASRMAGALRGCGLNQGDRVALFLTNTPEYLEILYGAWWAGLVVVPVNAKLHPQELAYVLENSQASALFLSGDLAAGVLPLLDQFPNLKLTAIAGRDDYARLLKADAVPLTPRQPDDLAWLFYTSGTTGKPKGVMLSHRNLGTMTACYFIDVDQARASDAAVYAAPLSHGAGIYNFIYVLAGARHVIPESGGFDEAELIRLAGSVGHLCFFAAPTMVRRLVEEVARQGADPGGFKTIVYGGGPMYVEDIGRALDVMGNCFVQIYGQGESPMTITVLPRQELENRSHPRWPERLASVGHAQALVEVMVGDEEGRPLPTGEIGEVMVRGESVMLGYWQNPEATGKTLVDGWLRTGDVGSLDQDGFLTLRDRSKDVIISGGSNIYPREVEEVLLRHPRVREASVVGRPDPEWGEVVVACVVTEGEVTQAELDALCLENIARFKRPKEYHFLPTLPKNNYGKVLKTELREQLKQKQVKRGRPAQANPAQENPGHENEVPR